jgi:hypothetical protein
VQYFSSIISKLLILKIIYIYSHFLMIIDMNKKELLLTTTVAITGLGIITIGAVSLPLTNITTQASGQGAAVSNNNNTITADAAGSALDKMQ